MITALIIALTATVAAAVLALTVARGHLHRLEPLSVHTSGPIGLSPRDRSELISRLWVL